MILSMRAFLQRGARFTISMGFLIVALTILAPQAPSDDLRADAQQLSDSAFAILNGLTSDSTKSGASDAMGAMASFAGDAQTLSAAVAKDDRDAAGAAMTALVADRRAVDAAMVKNPGAIESAKWSPLKAELAALQSRVPAAASGSVANASPAESHSDVVKPPASEAAATVPDGSAP